MKTREAIKKLGLVSMIATLLSGCAGNPVQIGPKGDERYDSTHPREISAQACGFQLLMFIPILSNSHAARAYQALKQQAGDDYIADVKVREEWTYAFVGTIYCTTMEATAYPRIKTSMKSSSLRSFV